MRVRKLLYVMLLGILLYLMPGRAFGATIGINSVNFPDEVFRAEVRRFDTSGNGYLSQSEIDAVTQLDLSTWDNADLTGIQYFTSLKRLICWGCDLTSLDLSANTALEELYLDNNALTDLTLGGSSLKILHLRNNSLTSLSLSGFPALTEIDCKNNKLNSLVLGNLSSLNTLDCSGNNLKTLTVTGCTALSSLDCSDNMLSALNVSGLASLYNLDCSENRITGFTAVPSWAESGQYVNANLSGNFISSFDISYLKTESKELDSLLASNPVTVNNGVIRVLGSSFDTSTTLFWKEKTFFTGRADRSVQSVTSCGNSAYEILWDDGLLSICGIGAVKDYAPHSTDGPNTNASPWYQNAAVKAIDVGENITAIGKYAFHFTKALDLSMHGDTEIGEYAFLYADISSIDFGSGNIRITGDSAFQSCKSLTELIIPANVSMEAREAFLFCTGLESLTLNNSGPLPDYSFEVCTSLNSLTINGGITSIGGNCFRGAPLTSVTLPASVASMKYSAFARTANNVTYPDLTELRIENPDFSVTDMIPADISGISARTTRILAPACSTMAAFAQKRSFDFTAIDDSRHTEELIAGTPADCIHSGMTDSVICTKCGYVITPAVEVAATGVHNFGEWEVVSEATCTADGQRKRVCQGCGLEESEPITSPGHSFTTAEFEWYEEKGPGSTPRTYKGVEWYPWSAVGIIKCSVCGAEGYEALTEVTTIMPEDEGGEYAKIIFVATGTDMVNGTVYTDRKELVLWEHNEHTWSDWSVSRDATCMVKGEEQRCCTECGEQETRETELAPHTEEIRNAVEATCIKQGYSGDVYCSVCEMLLSSGSIIPVTDQHTPKEMPATEATCGSPGYSTWTACEVCGAELVAPVKTAEATGLHDYDRTTISEATCTGWGSEHLRCKVCGYEADGNIEPRGHSFTKYESNNDATCVEDGTETAKCDRCDETHTRVIVGSHGHKPETIPGVEPTCVKGQTAWIRCSVCGLEIQPPQDIEPVLAHDFGEWTVISEPTCSAWGERTHTCRRCRFEETEMTEPTAHQFTVYEFNNDGNCTSSGTETAKCDYCSQTNTRLSAAAPRGHTPELIPGATPTCSEQGYTDGSVCSVCGEILKAREIIPASGHHYGNVTFEWTEDRNGGIPNLHEGMPWYSWTASGTCVCDRCGQVESLPTTTRTYTPDQQGGQQGKVIFLAYSYLDDRYWTEQKVTLLQSLPEPTLVTEEGDQNEQSADPAQNDDAAAKTAAAQIAEIPAAEKINLANKESIEDADRAYEALSDEQKKLVPPETVKELKEAKKVIAEMEAEAAAEEKAGHKTVEETDKALAALPDNGDPANSGYAKLALQAKKISNKSIKLQWNKVKGAAGYIIYGNKCGKGNKYQQLAYVKGASKKSYTLKKIKSGALKKNTYYKIIVAAYKTTKGGEQRVIAVSKSIHAATAGGRNGNPAILSVKKSVTVKAKKSIKLKVSQKAKAGTKIKKHRNFQFESSNPKIAAVTKDGRIKGLKKGKCTVYVYAQNGLAVKVSVTVKK